MTRVFFRHSPAGQALKREAVAKAHKENVKLGALNTEINGLLRDFSFLQRTSIFPGVKIDQNPSRAHKCMRAYTNAANNACTRKFCHGVSPDHPTVLACPMDTGTPQSSVESTCQILVEGPPNASTVCAHCACIRTRTVLAFGRPSSDVTRRILFLSTVNLFHAKAIRDANHARRMPAV